MILKPRLQDIKIIGYYLGKIILGLAFTMLIPAAIGLASNEINPSLDFIIGFELTLLTGLFLCKICFTGKDLSWMHGMIVVSISWVAAMFFGAVPLHLSGQYKSFLDACFDAMSGFATTGLALVQDLDHLSYSHNLWRHLTMFIGGQGIVIIALSLFIKGSAGAFKMYVGEAREEKILPNVIHTSRFIWLISITYLIIFTIALGFCGIFIGLKPHNAFFHGACIFMAGFDTGGFAPQSQSILYYHSLIFEIITILIMVFGALNFNFHYQLWTGNRKELWKNIETRAFLLSILLTFFVVVMGLSKFNVYPQAIGLFRKGFFQLISGHSTTGYMTVYARQFIAEWGDFALIGLIIAMAAGACVCSTCGGIKMLRLAVIFRAMKEDLKKIILPEKTIVVEKFHHIKEVFLEDKVARAALLVTFCYLVLYGIGTLGGVVVGFPFLESLFESVSAASNVGFSCGVTSVSMPAALKAIYIFQMWAGRLEFMSVFALLGFLVAIFKGK
ncbi:MAG: TrkH family potassium uptake protein [Candidatus Omnitrophota bacterium]